MNDNYLYIGIRDHFFTLRENERTVENTRMGTRVVNRRSHHQNLSQDPTEALHKAQALADQIGLPLRTRDGGADIINVGQLKEIHRRTAEQAAADRERAAKANAEAAAQKQKAEEDLRRAYEAEQMRILETGVFPPYLRSVAGKPIESEIGYVNWMVARSKDPDNDGQLLQRMGEYIAKAYPELILPEPCPDKHTGIVGKRSKFTAVVTGCHAFQGYYGVTYFTTMVTTDGACLISKGAFRGTVGAKITITAFVKEHDEYKGQAQTVINRVKIVEETK